MVAGYRNALFYQTILEQLPDPLVVTDTEGNIHYASPAFAQLLGYSPKELKSATIFNSIDTEQADIVRAIISGEGLIPPGGTHQVSLQLRHKSGRKLDYSGQFINLQESSEINGILIRFAETGNSLIDAFQGSFRGADLRAVFESASDGFVIVDKKMIIRAFNKRGKEQLYLHSNSKSVEEGLPIIDFIHPDDRQSLMDVFIKIFEGELFDRGWTFRSGDDRHWTHFCLYPILNSDKEIIGICIVGRDVTEQKQAEENLKVSEHRYKTLIQEGSDLINIIDVHGNYKYITAAIRSVLDPRVLGKNAFDFVHPDDREQLRKEFAELSTVKRSKSSPYRFRLNENEDYRWIETVATNLMDDPTIDGIVINSHDITELVKHTREVENRNEALEEIAWIQSHIVRAPLARILGMIEILKHSPDELSSFLPHLQTSAKELDLVIQDIIQKASDLGEEE